MKEGENVFSQRSYKRGSQKIKKKRNLKKEPQREQMS